MHDPCLIRQPAGDDVPGVAAIDTEMVVGRENDRV